MFSLIIAVTALSISLNIILSLILTTPSTLKGLGKKKVKLIRIINLFLSLYNTIFCAYLLYVTLIILKNYTFTILLSILLFVFIIDHIRERKKPKQLELDF